MDMTDDHELLREQMQCKHCSFDNLYMCGHVLSTSSACLKHTWSCLKHAGNKLTDAEVLQHMHAAYIFELNLAGSTTLILFMTMQRPRPYHPAHWLEAQARPVPALQVSLTMDNDTKPKTSMPLCMTIVNRTSFLPLAILYISGR